LYKFSCVNLVQAQFLLLTDNFKDYILLNFNQGEKIMPKKKMQDTEPVAESIQVRRIYTNAVRISHTFYDFHIVLGTMLPRQDGKAGPPMIAPTDIVYMSPQHAKVLSDILARQVANYEKSYGQIKTPPKSTA